MVKKLKFANPLKNFILTILGITENDLEQYKDSPIILIQNISKTPRDLMISFGTNIVRKGYLTNVLRKNSVTKNHLNIEKISSAVWKKFLGTKQTPDSIKIEKPIRKEIHKKEFEKALENFIRKYFEILLQSENKWEDILLKEINPKDINIITDTRFLSEAKTLNKQNALNVLIIKYQKQKPDYPEFKNPQTRKKLLSLYTGVKTVEDFLFEIQKMKIVKPAEELNFLLTLDYYMNCKNRSLHKDILSKIGKIEIIENHLDNDSLTQKNILKIVNQIKTNKQNVIAFFGIRRSGKDYVFEQIKNILDSPRVKEEICIRYG